MDQARTFRGGVLGGCASVKGFRLVASDGPVGRISWASYAPGESYLVMTTGLFPKRHRVLPAGAVIRVADHEVSVALSRAEVERLPLLPHPQAPVSDRTVAQMLSSFERAAAYTNLQ